MINKNNMNQDEILLSEKVYQFAYQYEQKYHYCSQCTVAALQKVLQIDSEDLFKASYILAGGLVNTCQGTCGALAGGAMIISYLFGRNSREFYEGTSNKKANYLTKKLYDRFVKEYGGCLCKDVHKKIFGRPFDFWVEEDKKIFEKLGGHVDKCPAVVGKTARWTYEIIQEEINKEKEKAKNMTINKEQKIKMFKTMNRIRTFEDKLQKIYKDGKLDGHLHTSHGQEAVAVGVMEALSDEDIIFSNHRGHGHFLARGTSPRNIIAECYGKVTGTNKGRSGSMYLVDIKRGMPVASGIVGGNICVATGSALASSIKKDNAVTISFFGDGATNIGFFHESLNMASLWNLPIIYICENNQYGEATKREEHQKIEKISDRASAYSMPGFTVDGTDLMAVYEAVKKVVDRAREGEGPALLECVVYRLRGHSAGDVGPYRPKKEEEEWNKKYDPIKKFKEELLEQKLLGNQEIEKIEEEIEKEIEEAVSFALDSEAPLAETVSKYVYREEENNE